MRYKYALGVKADRFVFNANVVIVPFLIRRMSARSEEWKFWPILFCLSSPALALTLELAFAFDFAMPDKN